MTRRSTIGFDRDIELDWLDATAARVADEVRLGEVRQYLDALLSEAVPGQKARQNTITVLTRIWAQPTPELLGLHGRAVALFHHGELVDRLGLHWAMMIGTYPFFADIASAIGRLGALQGEVALAQVTRRVVADWGERSTLVRATRRLIRSMVSWGVLRDTATRGIYALAPARREVPNALALLMLEAVLIDSEQDSLPLQQVTGHPALFPFKVGVGPVQIRNATQFQVHREGMDLDLVGIV